MTTFSQFASSINGWLGNRDYSVDLIANWTRMAEERLNNELRIRDMVKLALGVLTEDRVALPDDWLEMDFVRINDGEPLEYMARDDFYAGGTANKTNRFTYVGTNIVVGNGQSLSAPVTVEIVYFAMVPQFTDAETWLAKRHIQLLTAATLASATAYGVDDDRAVMWETQTQRLIDKLNVQYKLSKSSGSKLVMRRKGFG